MSTPPPPHAADEFGIPTTMFGLHTERFWGALGRSVALAALLEDKLLTLLVRVSGKPLTSLAKLPGTGVVERLRKETEDQSGWQGFDEYLGRCSWAYTRRHDMAHGLWPAKAESAPLFVHRVDREGNRKMNTMSMKDMQSLIDDLVSLVDEWSHWHAKAQVVETGGNPLGDSSS